MRRASLIRFVAGVLLALAGTGAVGRAAASGSLDSWREGLRQSVAEARGGEGPLDEETASRTETRFRQLAGGGAGEGRKQGDEEAGPLGWIREARSSQTGRERLLAHLNAMESQLFGDRGGEAAGEWGAGPARALEEVYLAREFRYLRSPAIPDWLDPVMGWLREMLEGLRDRIGGLRGVPWGWIQLTAYGIVLVLGFLLILWILRAFGGVGWSRRSPGMGAIIAPSTREKSWEWWRDEALRLAESGSFREAIRLRFISVLLEGNERGWWVYEAQATNREHLARLEPGSPRRHALEGLVGLYERVWYGLAQAEEKDFKAFHSWVRGLEESR